MSNKSGFEIRAEVLNQAQGILECNIRRENEAIMYNNTQLGSKDPIKHHSISTADVIDAAGDLYEFVNDKKLPSDL